MSTVNSEHKFQPGRSGNPSGRPRGSRSKSTQLVEKLVTGHLQDVKKIMEVVVAKALEGESWAVRELLARLWPVPRSRTVAFDLREIRSQHDVVDANNDILAAVAAGRLSADEASALADIVSAQSRALAGAELLDLAAKGKDPLAKQLMRPQVEEADDDDE
jgi:hypothetical protein